MVVGCAATVPDTTPDTAVKTVLRSPGGDGAVDSITWNLGSGEPGTLDPPNVPTYSAMAVVTSVCDSLLSVDESGAIVPGLASVTQESPLRAVFTLRTDATFWDGAPLTTEDVAYSLNRAASPSSYLAPTFANVAAISAISDTEVAIDFSAPDATFLPTMVGVGGVVMEKAFSENAGEALGTPAGGLMCSGPFEISKWNVGTDIRLVKNENYWDKGRAAKADAVRLTFITDTSALTQAMATGEVDGGWEIPASSIPALQAVDTGSLYFGGTTTIWSLRVASPDSILATNATLRQAFQQMIDRDAIAQAVFHGAAQPWRTAISPISWPASVRDSTEKRTTAIADGRGYDPEKAKQLVEEAGVEDQEIELIVASGDETASQLGQLVQAQAQAAGLSVSIRALQPLEYAQAMYDPAVRGDSDLLLSSSGDVVQEPLASIRYYYLPNGLYNWDGYVDEQLEGLFGEAVAELDEDRRTELTLDIQDRFEERAATISIVNPYQVNFVSDRVGGVITSSVYVNLPSLSFIGSAD
ncbi:ABC transporter substrate-binding protein [Microbacterium sp. LWO14-1.2]|uniref:ABC transporter substrate-binding protein n=2 Tax=Microbacterium TaxID=33882 RepID=UPI00313A0A59